MTGVEAVCLENNGHIKTASALVPPSGAEAVLFFLPCVSSSSWRSQGRR